MGVNYSKGEQNIIRCPICKSRVEKGQDVCATCGYSLLTVCLGCSRPARLEYQYCPACGRPLGVTPVPPSYSELEEMNRSSREQQMRYADDLSKLYLLYRRVEQYLPTGLLDQALLSDETVVGERRYLTVLFSDVVGFTGLSTQMDAEAVFLLMNECFRMLVGQVYKYGGSVDKFLGDGMMVLFGAPVSYGNDAERAVRAALGMQEAMAAFNQKMLAKLGTPLELRVGITSGEAIAGTVGVKGQQAYTVMGSTVNLASRLEGASVPGSILVNQDIYNHTQDLFNYRVLAPISVKGFDQPVPVFEVVGQLGDVRRLRQLPVDYLSPFVGREAELKRLAELARRTQAGEGGIVFVVGDVGLGKTRLIWEWQKQMPADLQVWSGVAQHFSQTSYDIWQQAILHGLNLPQAPRQKIMAALQEEIDDQICLAFLEFLLFGELPQTANVMTLEPEQIKEQVFYAVRRLLRQLAHKKPLVLIFDNLQWIDQLSRELLVSVFRLAATVPIVFCIGSRSGVKAVDEIGQRAREALGPQVVELSLGPLSQAESEELLKLRLPIEKLPSALRKYILERSRNNPYFLEELISFLMNRSLITVDENGWQIADLAQLKQATLPGSLRSLVQAQIDILPKNEQQILAYAAVVGSTVPAELLFRVLEQTGQATNSSLQLASLVDKTILSFDGINYQFIHNIVHEVIYQSLLTERRRQIHEQIGQIIEVNQTEKGWVEIEQLAHHFSEAGNALKAVPYLIEASERARQRFASESALNYLRTALALLPEAPHLAHHQVDLHKGIGDLAQHLGEYDEALTHYQFALEHTTEIEQQIDYHRLIGRVWHLKGEADQARDWLEKALAETNRHVETISPGLRGRIYGEMGLFYIRQRDYMQAERWSLDAIAALEQTDSYNDLARSLNVLGGAYYFQHRWRQALAQVERAYTIQEQNGDRMGLALSRNNLGLLYTIDGQWEKGIEAFQQVIAMCEEMGALETTLSNAHNNIAFLYLYRGNVDFAEAHLQESLAIKARNGTSLDVASTLNNLAFSRILTGNYEAAKQYLDDSLDLCQKNREQDSLCEAKKYLAEIKLRQGDEVAALSICQEAITLARQTASKAHEGGALCLLSRIQLSQGNPQVARSSAEASLQILQEINHICDIARTQAVLAEIALVEDDPAQSRIWFEHASETFTMLKATPDLKVLERFAQRLQEAETGRPTTKE